MYKIKIITHGIFKEYLEEEIKLTLEKKENLLFIKNYLIKEFLKDEFKFLEKILNKSVFSSKNKILNENYVIENEDIINLLPPFSGG